MGEKKPRFCQCIMICIALTIFVFTIQGLPGIDGKDGTPGIPGIKVFSTIMLYFLDISTDLQEIFNKLEI